MVPLTRSSGPDSYEISLTRPSSLIQRPQHPNNKPLHHALPKEGGGVPPSLQDAKLPPRILPPPNPERLKVPNPSSLLSLLNLKQRPIVGRLRVSGRPVCDKAQGSFGLCFLPRYSGGPVKNQQNRQESWNMTVLRPQSLEKKEQTASIVPCPYANLSRVYSCPPQRRQGIPSRSPVRPIC